MLTNNSQRLAAVRLTNFQKHKSLFIEFDKESNLIAGGNLAGKTTVGRALTWVVTDRPRGDWMRRIEAGVITKSTKVDLIFEDDTVISREKGNGVNRYVFNGDKYDNHKGIPKPITDYLGNIVIELNKNPVVVPITNDESSLFMIGSNISSSTRGALLNYLTGIDIADKAKKLIASELRDSKRKEDVCLDKLNETREVIKSTADILTIEKEFEVVGDNRTALAETIGNMAAIQAANDNLDALRGRVDALSGVAAIQAALTGLKSTVAIYETVNKYISLSLKVKKFAEVNDIKTSSIRSLLVVHESLCKEMSDVQRCEREIHIKTKSIDNIDEDLKLQVESIKKLEEKARLVQCPTCGSIVPASQIVDEEVGY